MVKELINGNVLYFDARYIRVSHHDGISRYSTGLIAALHETHRVVAIISDERQLEHLPSDIESVKLNDPTKPLAELFIASKLNKLGAKLVYSPMQTLGSLGRKFKLALTLHDLIYYRHKTPPSDFNWLIKIGWRLFHLTYLPQRLFLNRADAAITVSKTTKSLMQKHRLTKRPISVVYNAGASTPVRKIRCKPAAKHLVYMGSFMAYKNVETLVRAMSQLENYELHLLSRITDARKTELQKLAGSAAQRVKFFGGVSDEQYLSELDSAFALVSASLDEGFGIPLIESMERATPIVVSNLEIFEEVGGIAASYFDSMNPSDFAARILELDSGDNWQRASARALEQAKIFSWQQSARALVQALSEIK